MAESQPAQTGMPRSTRRVQLRKANLAALEGASSPSSFKLDSSLKRHTALIKRLKTALSTTPPAELTKEINSLSLEKYISEIVSAVGEGLVKCKTNNEISGGIEIMSSIHQRFPALFTPPLTSQLIASLAPPSKSHLSSLTPEQREKEDSQRIVRQRGLLRVFGEMELVGLVIKEKDGARSGKGEGDITFTAFKDLLTADKELLVPSAPLAVAFAKHLGPFFLPQANQSAEDGDAPTPREATATEAGAEHALDDFMIVPSVLKEKFKRLFTQYFEALGRRGVKDHLHMLETDRRNHEAYIRSGEIFEDRAQTYEKMAKNFEKLWNGVTTLSELLGITAPTLPSLPSTALPSSIVGGFGPSGAADDSVSPGVGEIWADEEEKRFYEDLLDLKGEVPGAVLGLGKGEEPVAEESKTKEEAVETEAAGRKSLEHPSEAEGEKNEGDDEAPPMIKEDPAEDAMPPAPAAQLQALLARLPECSSKDTIDRAAVDFAFLNSKPARKKLVRFLASVHRSRIDLLPYYSRLAATLSKYMPDIASSLVSALEDEFRYLQRKKLVDWSETRRKNTLFLAELSKFRVTPTHIILYCVKTCVDDLSGYNVDNLCNLLEGCGRFLLRGEATREKMATLLDTVKRKKNIHNYDQRQTTMLENAYYQCNPADRVVIPPRERTPMELFIRHNLYNVLSKRTVDKVTKTLRKLHWDDSEVIGILHRCFTKVWKIKFSNIHLFAILLHDLSRYHPELTVAVVDQVLEDIRLGMELNNFKYNQQRIASIRFLGEMYNYRVVDSPVILDTLWTCTTFGHSGGRPALDSDSPIDSADDFFRVRLVCTLLDTCGDCFDYGQLRRRMNNFLTFFQMYILTKDPPPMDIGFMISDTFEALRPKLVLFKTFEEAAEAVDIMMAANQQPSAGGVQEEAEESEGEEALSDDRDDQEEAQSEESEDDTAEAEGEQEHTELPEDAEAEIEADGDEDEDEDDDDMEQNGRDIPMSQDQEDEFARELAKMMMDSGDARKAQTERRNALAEVGLPFLKKQRHPEPEEEETENPPQHMTFTLLTKKGNKPQTRNMDIPLEAGLAIHTRNKQEQDKAEQRQLKKLVLEFEEREEAQEKKSLQDNLAKRFRLRYDTDAG